MAVTCQINNVSSPDAMVDFTQTVFVANEGDGVIDICMVLVPPSGGMECDLTLALAVENGKAGRLTYATLIKPMKLTRLIIKKISIQFMRRTSHFLILHRP